jgi:hydroxyethylthiazole kinase-like uncharacterized protein yjeF
MPSTPNVEELIFSRDALRAIDRNAVDHYGMPSIVLMENAAKGASNVIIDKMAPALLDDIVIVCGSGNNGGDGYALARHLVNHGCSVRILHIARPKTADASTNALIAERMDIPNHPWSDDAIGSASLIVDAIFGIGLDRTVQGHCAEAINATNEHVASCISLDIPSGLDCDTGSLYGCCVIAKMTITFVGMKKAFSCNAVEGYTGEVTVVDIGCPQSLLQSYGVQAT